MEIESVFIWFITKQGRCVNNLGGHPLLLYKRRKSENASQFMALGSSNLAP